MIKRLGWLPDASFGAGGVVDTSFTVRNTRATPSADGGLLVFGYRFGSSITTYAGIGVMKLTATGTYDPAFDSDPQTPGRHTLEANGAPRTVVTRGASRFILASGFVAKVDERGSYAAGFGTGGKVTFNYPTALINRADGLVVIEGGTSTSAIWTVADDGSAIRIFTSSDVSLPMFTSASSDGKLVGSNTGIIARTTTLMKSLDPTFGVSGRYSVVDQLSPVYIGPTLYSYGLTENKFTVSRRLDSGSVDPSFANGGAKVAPYSGGGDMTLVGHADGRLLFAVTTDHSSVYRLWP